MQKGIASLMINFENYEYIIHINDIPNIIEFLHKSYTEQRIYYYPILNKDIETCQKISFEHGIKPSCIFYDDDYMYLGNLIIYNAKEKKVFYQIFRIISAEKNEDLFIEFESWINRTHQGFSFHKNPKYVSPYKIDLLEKAEDSYIHDYNLDIIYMNDNNNLIAMFKKPCLSFQKKLLWENSSNDNDDYTYWTINHLLTTGIILKDGRHRRFSDYNEFYSMIKKQKDHEKSIYEKQFIDCYCNYLDTLPEDQQLDTPLLIPEYRFGGPTVYHKYRLDFLIINLKRNKRCGIELSPSSTHINQNEPEKQWFKEINKRNDFQRKYNLMVFTYTDEYKNNMNKFFKDFVIENLITQTYEEE